MIRDELSTGYTALSLLIFVGPMVGAMILDPPLLLLADRLRKKTAATAAMLAVAVCLLVAALAPNAWWLAGALAVWASVTGVTNGIAQAAMVDSDPTRREQRLSQWTLAGWIGDLISPVLLAITAAWRPAMVLAALLSLVWALLFQRAELPATKGDEDDGPKPSIKDALKNRPLMGWLAAHALCTLLDEIVIAFAVLFVRDELHGGVEYQSAVCIAFTIGGIIGVGTLPRVLERSSPQRVLITSCVACAAMYIAWLSTRNLYGSVVLMTLVGSFTAPLYPLAKARAYAAIPERSSLVNALEVVFVPFEIAAPIALGLIADRFGIIAALACLVLQPLGILAIALLTRNRHNSE